MARERAVGGTGPGCLARVLSGAVTAGTIAVVVAGTFASVWWYADRRGRDLGERAGLERVHRLAGVLQADLENAVRARHEAQAGLPLPDQRPPALDGEADAARLDALRLPADLIVRLSDATGVILHGADRGKQDPCCLGLSPEVPHEAVHAPGGVPAPHAIGQAPPVHGRVPTFCTAVVLRGPNGEPLGRLLVQQPATYLRDIHGVSLDIGILAAGVAILAGLMLTGALERNRRWQHRLRRHREDQTRWAATVRAAEQVLGRLVPHLGYEIDTEPKLANLVRTVDAMHDRKGLAGRVRLDLSALVAECLERRRPDLEGAHRVVRAELASDVWVEADPARLGLVVDHLVRNAIEALGDAPGRIEVAVQHRAGGAVLRVRDTGPGIPRSVRRMVFDAGFTTRPGHPGMGLTLVKRVIEDHGGWVRGWRARGGGMAFECWLPRTRRPVPGAEPVRAPAPPPPGPQPVYVLEREGVKGSGPVLDPEFRRDAGAEPEPSAPDDFPEPAPEPEPEPEPTAEPEPTTEPDAAPPPEPEPEMQSDPDPSTDVLDRMFGGDAPPDAPPDAPKKPRKR